MAVSPAGKRELGELEAPVSDDATRESRGTLGKKVLKGARHMAGPLVCGGLLSRLFSVNAFLQWLPETIRGEAC